MSGFFDRMLGRGNENKGSSETAKARLKFVLEHDRINISPEKLREMKERIIAVIAEYVSDVDPASVDILLEQSDRYNNKIVAEIPFTKPRASRPAEDRDGNDDLVDSDDNDADDFQFVDEVDAPTDENDYHTDATKETPDDIDSDDDTPSDDDDVTSDTDDISDDTNTPIANTETDD